MRQLYAGIFYDELCQYCNNGYVILCQKSVLGNKIPTVHGITNTINVSVLLWLNQYRLILKGVFHRKINMFHKHTTMRFIVSSRLLYVTFLLCNMIPFSVYCLAMFQQFLTIELFSRYIC